MVASKMVKSWLPLPEIFRIRFQIFIIILLQIEVSVKNN